MANNVTGVRFRAGYITLQYEGGTETRYAIASVLRALDIPIGLTYSQVQAVTAQ